MLLMRRLVIMYDSHIQVTFRCRFSSSVLFLIPMTHVPENGAINLQYSIFFRRRFLARASCKSGTGFVLYHSGVD